MKYPAAVLGPIVLFLAACGNPGPSGTPPDTGSGAAPGTSAAAPLTLAKKSGCLACHKVDGKLMGPAWTAVAERYRGDPDARNRLINKVKSGGAGNWTKVTGGMPMPPNYPRVSDEDITKLVDFVLALKK